MKLIKTPVHVADNVEWPMLVLKVVPEWLPFDNNVFDLSHAGKLENVTKAFALEISQRTSQLLTLLTNDVWTKITIRSLAISILTEPVRQIQHNGNREAVIFTCERHQRL